MPKKSVKDGPARRYLRRLSVVRVIDGDTIEADVDLGFGVTLRKQVFRLLGINAWETRGHDRKRGLLAKQALQDHVAGCDAMLETVAVPDGEQREKYGRWLAILWTPGGQCINRQMIDEGHAVEAWGADQLRAAEAAAGVA